MFDSYYQHEAVKLLIPERLAEVCNLPEEVSFTNSSGAYRLTRTETRQGLRLEVYQAESDRDPCFVVELAFSFLGQIEITWIGVVDISAQRFNVDANGNLPLSPKSGLRNIEEELRAMAEKLMPNQVRRGLHLLRQALLCIENYAAYLGVRLLSIFPMAYHNAIEYERCGFSYRSGQELMERIHEGFSPQGDLLERLDSSTPFRQKTQANSIGGRSWAIHDGILEDEWFSPDMYKIVGESGSTSTAPFIPWWNTERRGKAPPPRGPLPPSTTRRRFQPN